MRQTKINSKKSNNLKLHQMPIWCYRPVVRMASIVFVDPGKDVILDLWWIDFVHLFLLLPITLTSRINALRRWQGIWSLDDNENKLKSPLFLVQKLIDKMQIPSIFSANCGQDCGIPRGIVKHSFGNQTYRTKNQNIFKDTFFFFNKGKVYKSEFMVLKNKFNSFKIKS